MTDWIAVVVKERKVKDGRRFSRHCVECFKTILLLILFLTPMGLANRSLAQMPPPDMPLHFRFVGEFYDPEKDKEAGGVNAYTVTVEDKQWIFDIEKADALFGAAQGLSVIKKIYPPLMTFTGPKDLMDLLKNPEIAGKPYTLEGHLYLQTRTFRLTQVQSNAAEKESDAQPSSK